MVDKEYANMARIKPIIIFSIAVLGKEKIPKLVVGEEKTQ
jgi:hypothetical protein